MDETSLSTGSLFDNPRIKPTNQSITIAFLGPYVDCDQLTLNGSLVVRGMETLNVTQYSDWNSMSTFNIFMYLEFGAMAAIRDINRNPNILPNVHINVKRFNVVTPDSFGTINGGYVVSQTIVPIAETHTDVIALFGDITGYRIPAVTSFYKLPAIDPRGFNYGLLDRIKYPYYMQLDTMDGTPEVLVLLLNRFKVTRLAMICEKREPMCITMTKTLQQNGFDILMLLDIHSDPDYIGLWLKKTNARYIYLDGPSYQLSFMYEKLASKGFVGKDFVYFGPFCPEDLRLPSDGQIVNNHRRGFIYLGGFNDMTEDIKLLQQHVLDTVSTFTSLNITDEIATYTNLFASYDSIWTLAAGIDKVLKHQPNLIHENIKLCLETTNMGDLRAPYVLNSFMGSDLTANPFAKTDLNWSKLLDFNESNLIFNDGSNIPPPDGALIQSEIFIHYSSTSGIILMLFAVVGIFSTLFTLRVILVNRSKSSLRHSSPQYLAVILLGIIGLYCNAFLYLGQIRDCFMTLWIPVLSYSCIVGTMAIKNVRIYLIFSGQKVQAKFLKDAIYVRYLIIVLWFEVALLAVWTKLSSAQSVKIELAPDSYAFACQFSTRMDWPYALIALFNIILGLFALLISGLIWNVEAAYNESSEMLWTVIAMVFYALASFALDKGADFGRKLIFKAGASCTMATFILLILCLPKLIALWYEKSKERYSNSVMMFQPSSVPSITKNSLSRKNNTRITRAICHYFVCSVLVSKRRRFEVFDTSWILAQVFVQEINRRIIVVVMPATDEGNAAAFVLAENIRNCGNNQRLTVSSFNFEFREERHRLEFLKAINK